MKKNPVFAGLLAALLILSLLPASLSAAPAIEFITEWEDETVRSLAQTLNFDRTDRRPADLGSPDERVAGELLVKIAPGQSVPLLSGIEPGKELFTLDEETAAGAGRDA
ncbi:MAG: hypothetical protein LBQ16_01865, partial [Gracilibacteraceae bacterium]|nr:hypothetical protein [Gracilibacteraceae bacterium]